MLSAASINYSAIFDPIGTHPGAILVAVASRDIRKAQAQIAKYKLKEVVAYGSYEELLADRTIDAVYIGLPNSMHCSWAIKAMESGKHVLIEKAITSNAQEVEDIRQCSLRTGKVALEASHWQFHPAAHRVKQLIDSGDYGQLQSVTADMSVLAGMLPRNDIRFDYRLGGGAAIDLAYVFSTACYFCSADQNTGVDVLDSSVVLAEQDPKVDRAIKATFILRNPGKPGITCTTTADLALPNLFGIFPRLSALTPTAIIELEKAQIRFDNMVGPWFQHAITITMKDENGKLTKKKEVQTCYQGGPEWGSRGKIWWTTYRYQLEAFCDRVKSPERLQQNDEVSTAPGHWLSLEESTKVMSLIDAVYEKVGLPKRGLTVT